jgi:aconitate hydratase
VVSEYLDKSGLTPSLDALGFQVVGYGCTTCIGNSGPLAGVIDAAIDDGGLVVSSVLSGNRNFEGRVHAKVRSNYLASPPLVVAYALAGNVQVDLLKEPLGQDESGVDVYLRDVWPSTTEVAEVIDSSIDRDMFKSSYEGVYEGPAAWQAIDAPTGATFDWNDESTYIKSPPFFADMGGGPRAVSDIEGARVLCLFGDSITTDHISPAGSIPADGPAGHYLQEQGVKPVDFNSFGSRRGNHEVMMRGTFANVRIKNRLRPGTEGGVTAHQPSGDEMSIFDAAERYRGEDCPTIILAGKEYGTGSSRDWAAKGPSLLGVRAVIVESFERIHRSNLVGMGVLPLQFCEGDSAESLGLTGSETYDVVGLAERYAAGQPTGGQITVRATRGDGQTTEFQVDLRIDTPEEAHYFHHGGILRYVLRRLAGQ